MQATVVAINAIQSRLELRNAITMIKGIDAALLDLHVVVFLYFILI
jgi:hypothetical protein